MRNRELELLVINNFIIKSKIDRYSAFVSKDKTRLKFISSLAHFEDLDPQKFSKISVEPKVLFTQLSVTFNFSDCYVISENKKIDGNRLSVTEAANSVVGYGMGTFLVFGLANIVYYEGENANDRWIGKMP